MGEVQCNLFRPEFNRSIEVEARPERLSGDAGALLLREIFSLLEMEQFFEERLSDPRFQPLVTHPLIELLRTDLLLLAQGFRDQDDADSLRDDPILRLSVSQRRGTHPLEAQSEGSLVPDGLASQPTLSRLQRIFCPQRCVLSEALVTFAGRRIRMENRGHRHRYATLDVDSFPIEVFGHQEGSAYNGYYNHCCYHPLVASVGETGDLLAVRLRRGNAHTAEGGLEFVLALLEQMEREICQVASVRMDAGFPEETLLSALETREVGYVARIRKNARLEAQAKPWLEKAMAAAPGACEAGPGTLTFQELSYRAGSWSRLRRVVLVLKHEHGELFPEHFFLLTNWSAEEMPPECLLALYRRRGMAEGQIGEFKSILEPALSSTRRRKSHYRGESPRRRTASQDPFAANEVKLLLNALAYNLMHAARRLVARETQDGWSLGRFRERFLKVPARVLVHARRVTVVINRPAVGLWTHLLRALERWRERKRRLAWA